ncbi:hypothetical protein BCR39DRAFT_393632 [Naematelia encephala]|uniref:Uncharacterized protein n=1 Tax=Naematelia encephala TaxID=71784 RepID=A0A1Y2AHV6_9TREE|nr:hypothetical protein BCR39DRAFT_393632 [Naematelia encephala]
MLTPTPIHHHHQPGENRQSSHITSYHHTRSIPLATAHPNLPHAQRRTYSPPATPPKAYDGGMSDSASPSPPRSSCFCGRALQQADTSIYCSVDCARSDAFSSLCFKPTAPPSPPTYAPLSRNPSISSTCSTDSDWQASHYRRLARAEERKEERRRRRTAGSTASSNVPELVHHSHSHSRNPSIASTVSSNGWSSIGGLSRNPSSASTASSASRRVRVDAAIMEDEDEDEDEEMLDDVVLPIAPIPRYHHQQQHQYPQQQHQQQRRRGGANTKALDGIGMGKDMRDVLEEIIQMEQGFQLDDEDNSINPTTSSTSTSSTTTGLLCAQLPNIKPPKTPPIGVESRRRSSFCIPNAPARAQPYPRRNRPPSMMGLHLSSLSESHTALYLATASPTTTTTGTSTTATRRSASPKLETRRSLTFDPNDIPALIPPSISRYDSPNLTPSRRRFANTSTTTHHPTMDGWKFPSTPSSSSSRHQSGYDTNNATTTPTPVRISEAAPGPLLLWPGSRPPPLAPALFPSSPGMNTTPVSTGMRLGVMLDSSSTEEDEAMDVDDADGDGDDGRTGYLPVFLEAEGFRDRWAAL